MASLDDLAFSVVKLLHEEGALDLSSALSFLVIKEQLNLTRWSLAGAEEYLLERGHVAREGLGPTRDLWLTEDGVALVNARKAA